jgi:hypothetical protein
VVATNKYWVQTLERSNPARDLVDVDHAAEPLGLVSGRIDRLGDVPSHGAVIQIVCENSTIRR